MKGKYRIRAKFAEYVLCPDNAIENAFYQRPFGSDFVLLLEDGSVASAEFISTWNNEDGTYDDELEELCMRRFGCHFSWVKSVWIARVDVIGDYWHLIKLYRD